MHVIPVEKAIPTEQKSLSIEHISHWLKKYEGKYAVGACSCRRSRRILGEGCGHLEDDMCIGVGDMADYIVETGKGRYIDIDEVMEILQRAEDNGFVHQITNIDGEDKIFAICNCCVCSCYALRTSQYFNTPNMSRSSYIAKVDTEKCVACGQCVEYCPAGAASSWDRSSAPANLSNIRCGNCLTQSSGVLRNGARITETKIRSTVMTRELPLVRPTVRLILPCRVT